MPRNRAHVWILGMALAIGASGFAASALGEEWVEVADDLSGLLTAPVNENSTVEAAREIYQAADEDEVQTAPVKRQLETLEEELVSLNRDLLILEEDLLYPASSRVSVFLSMDLGDLFSLDSVTVKLNGQVVVDDVVLENYWERDKPIYPTGQIELQNHGSTLWFRNIYIREIPPQ